MFKKSEILQKEVYKPNEVASILGLTTTSLRNYAENGILDCIKTVSGQRRYKAISLCEYLDNKGLLIDDTDNKCDVIYARVSTAKQKISGDLERQINNIKLFIVDKNPKNLTILSDVASGINDNRKGLNQLLQLVQQDKVDRVFINYKDRLTRFGFKYIKQICDFHNTEIIIVSDESNDKSLSEELAEDIIAIIHSFSGKLYGMRRKISKAVSNIEGDDNERW